MLAHSEVVIIGGGPVGLTQALKLAKQGKQVVLIDKAFNYENDGRVLAISYLSCQIISDVGIDFDQLEYTKIEKVEISHHGLGISTISYADLDLPELGITLSYTALCNALLNLVKKSLNIKLVCQEVVDIKNLINYSVVEFLDSGAENILTCDLLIMAEGGQLLRNVCKKRDFDYQQSACIFHIKTEKEHNNIAYERFASGGTLVLLPFADHYVVVWSLETNTAMALGNQSTQLVELLDQSFTKRLGGAKLISAVKSFPLRLSQVNSRVDKRMVVIGNSAQTVHPVSAQGLNLGLRDVQRLSEILEQEHYTDSICNYDKLRNFDVNSVINFTHLLATKLEHNENSVINHARGSGLILFSNLPLIKNFVSRSLIFGL